MLPATVVPSVKTGELDLRILQLQRLADQQLAPNTLHSELREFVAAYEQWIVRRENAK